MKVKVTWTDILKGELCNPFSCPIALCLKRELLTNDVSVLPTTFRVGKISYNLPKSAMIRIEFYDLTRIMLPFFLEIPDGLSIPKVGEIKTLPLTTPSEIYHPLIKPHQTLVDNK